MRKSLRAYAAMLLALLSILLFAMPVAAAETNLLANGGFEQVDANVNPAEWYRNAYYDEIGYSRLSITDEIAHSGQYSAVIENASPNDARFICTVKVKPSSLYKMSGYVLVESMDSVGNGANFAIEDIYAVSDCLFEATGEWEYVEWYGRTGVGQKELTIGIRIGGYGAESLGKAYFDDIVFEKVETLPEGVEASGWYVPKNTGSSAVQKTPAQTSHNIHVLVFVLVAFVYVGICWLLVHKGLAAKLPNMDLIAIVALTAAFMVRVLLGAFTDGYPVDIGCFQAWSLRMAQNTPLHFYSPDYFCDYPPGYMLLLWPVGLLLQGALPTGNQALVSLILKSVPMVCDLFTAVLLYLYGKKHWKPTQALFAAAFYVFNPMVLLNSAVWGQVDSVLALLLAICAVTALEYRWSVALPVYFVSILVKPQALLFAPVAGIWLLVSLFGGMGKTFKEQKKELLLGLGIGVAAAVAIVLPFSVYQEKPLKWLFDLYGQTLSSYAYATVNTANLYYLLAANWVPISKQLPALLPLITALLLSGIALYLCFACRSKEEKLLRTKAGQTAVLLFAFAAVFLVYTVIALVQDPFTGQLDYGIYGYTMMVLVFAAAILLMLHDKQNLPFYLAFALLGVYLFGVKIHERYLFPALVMLVLAYVRVRDKRLLWLLTAVSCTMFVNTAIILDNALLFGSSSGHLNDDTLALNVFLCIINLAAYGYGAWIAYTGLKAANEETVQKPKTKERILIPAAERTPKAYRDMLLSPTVTPVLHLSLKDWLIMAGVTLAYALLTFSNLGSTVAPQHGFVTSSAEETITFELEKPSEFSVLYYAGVSNYDFSISVSDDGINWSEDYPCQMREGLCYRWNYAVKSTVSADGNVNYASNQPAAVLWLNGRYLRLNAENSGLNLFEIVTRGRDGSNLPMSVVDHHGANEGIIEGDQRPEYLLDEQYTCVGEPSWYNGTYFDEIYHARTAYEHLHGQRPHETTHPPLGKLLMAAAISVFGMTPFGWRFAGALTGVLMLPALYVLAKQLFKRTDLATLSMGAFALDLMHFTQTRIATIDSFPVFFILLSYWFMVRYMQTDVFALEEGEKPVLFTRAYWKSLTPLALSGIMMGLSIASKWIGIYSAVGLAILYFTAVYRQYRAGNVAFSYAMDNGEQTLTPLQKKRIRGAQDHALNRIFITCGFCVLFFILVPCIIYYLSYIPYLAPTGRVTLQRVIDAQIGMLEYHSTPGLGMDHPFQSPWWQWPFILKPMWFNQDAYEPAGYASTIVCMGNPWVFYLGAVAMLAVMAALVFKYLRVGRKGFRAVQGDGDLTLYVLVIAFLSQYLPWVLVPRSMYMYHYFASVPFIILATAWWIGRTGKKNPKITTVLIVIYLVAALAFFIMFYPYASGALTSTEWLDAMKWFPSKVFTWLPEALRKIGIGSEGMHSLWQFGHLYY